MVMANWTPGGFVGQLFKVMAAHVSPPPGIPPPVLWGGETSVRERLRDGVANVRLTWRRYPMMYPFGVPAVVEFYRRSYGPTQCAFAALDTDGQAALRRDLERLWSAHNRATDGTTQYEAEYLEVVALRGAR